MFDGHPHPQQCSGTLTFINHQYAIRRTRTGKIPGKGERLSFLSASNGGGRKVNAMTANSALTSDSKFRLIPQADGSFAPRTSNAFDLVSADDDGGLAHGSPQIDNLFATQTQVQDWEKFRIQETSRSEIQTVRGFFIAVKNDFTNISTRISFPDEAPSIGYTAKFELIMTST